MIRALIFLLLAPFLAHGGEVIMNADTGEIIAGADQDAPRYPASVTKLMTIYVALDAVRRGEIALDAEITISKRAAAAPPVKLGLKAGKTIRLQKAIHAALIVSSNDAARVIAEAVSGSEAAFAKRMTTMGRRIGLKATTFRNASGLPAKGHLSTTADMARLAAEVDRAFGAYLRKLFRASFTYAGRRFGPRNSTVASPKGARLGKTGFTCAAGYTAAILLDTPQGRIAIATTANGGSGARATSLKRLVAGGVAVRKAARGCRGGGAKAKRNPSPHLAPRDRPLDRPLDQWALTLGVFPAETAALAALDAGRAALAKGDFALGHRMTAPGVYALLLTRTEAEAEATRVRLSAAGLRANIIAPRGAEMLGLAVGRPIGG